MPVEIVVPQLGESVVEATVARWLKQPGDTVEPNEPIVALETDKVDLDVSVEQGGVLGQVNRNEGDTVSVGEVLGLLETDGVPAAAEAPPAKAAPEAVPEPAATVTDAEVAPAASPATPLARSMARQNQVDIGQVPGTGPRGKVTREDVQGFLARSEPGEAAPAPPAIPRPMQTPIPGEATPAAAQTPAPPPASIQASDRPEERRKLSRRRQTIAARLVEAQRTAAMLTTFNEVDMSAIMDLRARRKEAFEKKHGVGLGFMSFFTRAVIGALKAFPMLNAEIQGDEVVVKGYYDIGIAVSTEEGLVVPVVRDADRLSFAGIERAVSDLATRAREGSLTLPELYGGTFTITNGGVFGSLLSTPILNAPQVGILGMHKIEQRPVVVDGQVVVRPMMYLALSYDHRLIDGSEAVRFLVAVKELLEDPARMLLEV